MRDDQYWTEFHHVPNAFGQEPMPAAPYTVTVYVAAPGTPVRDKDSHLHTSAAGHVYYSISDGMTQQGYGFAPKASGAISGPGEVVRDEFDNYQNPLYARTLEITQQQYEKLREYGKAGLQNEQKYFNLHYNGATNSCIDFVWTGLNHAGMHFQRPLPEQGQIEFKGYEGALKPLWNIEDFRSIPAPFPDSPHNREERHNMPDRSLLQRLLSEQERAPSPSAPDPALSTPPAHAGTQALFDHLYAAMQTGDDSTFRQAISTVANADINREFHAQVVAQVDMQERQAALEAQLRQSQEQVQAMEQSSASQSRRLSL